MKQGNTKLARLLLRIAGISNALLFFTLCCEATANGAAGLMALMLLPLSFWVVALLYATREALWFEMGKDRVFRRVCLGIGFKGEAPSWKFGLMGRLRGDTKIITPQLRDVHGTHEGWTGIVRFFDGQTIEKYTNHADAFALGFQVPFCTFELAENGLIRVRAGQVPVPDAYSHPGHVQALQGGGSAQAVSQVVPMVPNVYTGYEQGYQQQGNVWAYELELLKGVPMARNMQGRTCRIPIESNHWFIAARTNGGKSSWIWSLVLGLEPAFRLGLVKFWGIDSKMIELAIGRGWFEHYADDDESSVELLEQCVRDMHERARQMQGVQRKFVPSVQTPLNVVVIDEMGYLSAYLSDKKMQARANTAIAALLAKGRAPGYAVVGCVQDPRKEVCGFRDGFSIRIAGSLPAPMVDLVLGEGMYAAGANCDRLPLTEPGVAYVISETTLKPVLVRAAWCSDSDIQGMLSGAPAQSQPLLNTGGAAAQVKDEPTGQLDWNGQPLQQFPYRVE